MRFENEAFQRTHARDRAIGLLDSLEYAIERTWPAAHGFKDCNITKDWASAAVELKQTLMIAPSDYRIHYCRPGSLFDPAWMVAENAEGFPVRAEATQSMRVAVCLSPALTEQAPALFRSTQPYGTF